MRGTTETTLAPAQNDPDAYYAGGHATMWDFPSNAKLVDIASRIYECGGAIAKGLNVSSPQ